MDAGFYADLVFPSEFWRAHYNSNDSIISNIRLGSIWIRTKFELLGIYFCRDHHFSVQYPMEATALLQQNENSQHSNIQKAIQSVLDIFITKHWQCLILLKTTEPKIQPNISVHILVLLTKKVPIGWTNSPLNSLKLSFYILTVQWRYRADKEGNWLGTYKFWSISFIENSGGFKPFSCFEITVLEESVSVSEIIHSRIEGQLT